MENRILPVIVLLIIVSLGFSAKAQQAEVVPGDLLVRMLPGHHGDEMAEYLNGTLGASAKVRNVRLLSRHMNIYQIHFDPSVAEMDRALESAWTHPFAETVQFNHVIKSRATTPNDAAFSSQWQYINTGQGGGTPGADIDADLAWDITTGGVTALGDTIVACIIDDGLDPSHTDFGDNVWYNRFEIPNNGIDDDGNGFVDDYDGWNAYGNNDNVLVSSAGHGTPVAGIVGAQGNNGTGVAGVNWDVKLMIVRGGGGESDAIAAYSYPLEMRKMYNATGGQKGAFVVATNASWGVDFGQPANAPLWCAMYDTLGAYGIINCGATINGNVDVDTQGDLPTGCASDYLISVTNMNRFDTKETQAGYGDTTIDLGSFGAGTYTTASGNSYGGFGGTSGATPHVTGAAALLYSSPCPNFADVARAFPDSAALLVKEWILNGVDANSSLANITVTGGRQNLYKSLQEQANWNCNGNGCFTAYNLNTSALTDTSVTLTWAAHSSADTFDFDIRVQGAANWTSIRTNNMSQSLDNLTACTVYEWRIRSRCSNSNANYSQVITFRTDGCCEAPIAFSDSVVLTTAVIEFDPVLAAQSYNIRYRIQGTGSWTTLNNQTSTAIVLSGLDSCVTYEYEVQTVCDTGLTAFGASQTFVTEGCVGCDQSYCSAYGASNSDEWILEVRSAYHSNTSAAGPNGYEDFTGGTPFILIEDDAVSHTFETGYSGFSFSEVWQVFVDLNRDGQFADPGELFLQSPPTQNSYTGSIAIPAGTQLGLTRMRVVMQYNDPAGACAAGFDYGEVEDYCVDIKEKGFVNVAERLENDLMIYPNPFRDRLNIELMTDISIPASARLYDLNGKTIKSVNFGEIGSGTHRFEVETGEMPGGLYLIEVQMGDHQVHRKLTLLK